MEYFRKLGETVEQRWSNSDFDERALPELADQALAESPAHHQVTIADLIEWVQTTRALPHQFDLSGTFGEPPLTVYRSGRLVVDVYFWLDGTTSIHQHSFSGAFQVLAGSSSHVSYRFDRDEQVSAGLQIGRLSHLRAELLRAGDTRPIPSGSAFIHSLFHLDRPSATVVIRTPTDVDCGPQFRYLKPFLAVDQHSNELVKRQLQTLNLLWEMDREAYQRAIAEAAPRLDYGSLVAHLVQYAHLRGDMARLDDVLSAARRRHGARVEVLGPVLRELRRSSLVIQRRQRVHDAGHRFFLALLLDAPDREQLLRLVQARYPGEDAIEKVIEWVRELTAGSQEADGAPLGVAFGDDALPVFDGLLRGQSYLAIRDGLERAGFDVSDALQDIGLFHQRLQRSPLLSGLFPPAPSGAPPTG